MIRISNMSWYLSVLVAVTLLLAACGGSSGGGSGGSSDSDPEEETASISGTAEAPGGTVAALDRGPLDRFLAFVAGDAVAAVTGLQPVANATVELVRLDDDGNVTEVIDTTQTSATGDYVFSLDEEVDLTGNLAVRVDSAADLRAQVTGSEDVRVDPVSELVLRKLIEARANLAGVSTSQVVALRGKVDAVDIDLSQVADLEAAIAEVDAIAGDTLQSDARNIVEGEGDAAAVAGDWYRVMAGRELGPGGTEAESEHGPIGFVAGDGADLTAEIGVVDHQSAFTDSNGALDLSTRVDDADTFPGLTVTGKGVIVFDVPLEELPPDDPNGTFDVFPPKTVRVATAGDLAAALSADVRLQYEAEDTDGDGNPDTRGDLVRINRGMILDLFGRAQSDTLAADLAGNWGVVRQYLELEEFGGKIEVNTFDDLVMAADNLGGTGTLSFGEHEVTEIDLFADASENETVLDTAEEDIPFEVEDDGALEIAGFLNGFVTADNNVFVVAGLNEEDPDGEPRLIGKTVLIGVRRSDSLDSMDLADRSYRYIGYLTEVDGGSTTLFQQSEGVMQFGSDADTLSITGVSEREVERSSVNAEATAESRQLDLFEDATINVALDGAITTPSGITLDNGVSVDLNGFVAPGGEIVVLGASFDDPEGGAGSGLIIGLPLAEAE